MRADRRRYRFVPPLRASLLVFAGLCAAAAPAAGGAPSGEASAERLPNGLRVIASGGDGGRVEAILLVRAGWAYDPEAALGAAELSAGALSWGSREASLEQVREALRSLGATLSSQVARDYALLQLSLEDGDRLGEGLALLAELAGKAALRPSAIERVATGVTTSLLALRDDPSELASRRLAQLVYGATSPLAGLPDPWRLQTDTAAAVEAFHAAHYRPDASILVVAGVEPELARRLASAAFGAWPRPDAPLPQLPSRQDRSGADAPRILLMPSRAPGQALVVGFVPEAGERLTLYALASLLASRLGEPAAASSPLAASGLAELRLGDVPSPALALERLLRELRALGSSGPAAEELDTVLATARETFRRSLADPAFLTFWLGAAELYGWDADPGAALARVSAEAVQAAARAVLVQHGWRAVAVGRSEAAAELRSLGGLIVAEGLEPSDPTERERAARGARILARALGAQADPDLLRAIRHVEERAAGEFFGIGTRAPVRYRRVTSPPDRVYVESVLYTAARFVVNRVQAGELSVDRSAGSMPGNRAVLPVILREALRQPALALIRPYDLGLVRWVDSEEGEAGQPAHDILEVLDPAAGVARYWIRREDAALTRLAFDLRPLEDSREEHRFSDFRQVAGVRLPFGIRSSARDRPLMDLRYESIAFPSSVPEALYTQPAELTPEALAPPATAAPAGQTDAGVGPAGSAGGGR